MSVHGPVGVHESILGSILWHEEGGGMTEMGAETHVAIDTNLKAFKIQKTKPSLSQYIA